MRGKVVGEEGKKGDVGELQGGVGRWKGKKENGGMYVNYS